MKKHKTSRQLISKAALTCGNCTYFLDTVNIRDISSLMEKYAKQQSIAFYKWMESGCWIESFHNPGEYFDPLTLKFVKLSKLYKQFLKSQK